MSEEESQLSPKSSALLTSPLLNTTWMMSNYVFANFLFKSLHSINITLK